MNNAEAERILGILKRNLKYYTEVMVNGETYCGFAINDETEFFIMDNNYEKGKVLVMKKLKNKDNEQSN
jgi:hypothetical protein